MLSSIPRTGRSFSCRDCFVISCRLRLSTRRPRISVQTTRHVSRAQNRVRTNPPPPSHRGVRVPKSDVKSFRKCVQRFRNFPTNASGCGIGNDSTRRRARLSKQTPRANERTSERARHALGDDRKPPPPPPPRNRVDACVSSTRRVDGGGPGGGGGGGGWRSVEEEEAAAVAAAGGYNNKTDPGGRPVELTCARRRL